MLNWILQKKSIGLGDPEDYVLDVFRKPIAAAQQVFPRSRVRRRVELSRYVVPEGERWQPLRNLSQLLGNQRKLFVDVVLHGSVATKEAIPRWSDVDVLAILRQDVLSDSQQFARARQCLLAAEEELYRFDPFQHHGVQVVTEADLLFYPECFLPVTVLRRGASLLRKGSLSLWVRDSRRESVQRFWAIVDLLQKAGRGRELRHHARNGEYLKDDFHNADQTFYQFKYFVSVVLLLPSLFLELVEGSTYKKDSFTRIDRYFTERELELVRACEKVRLLAPQAAQHDKAIPSAMQLALGKNYLQRAARLVRRMWKEYEVQESTA